jgi:hypothetical protein
MAEEIMGRGRKKGYDYLSFLIFLILILLILGITC